MLATIVNTFRDERRGRNSGKPCKFTKTCITRMEDGHMAKTWDDFDRVRLWLQLGVKLVVPEQ
jgi:hypothetical protein